MYEWETEKDRIQMVIVTALVAFLAGGIAFIGEKANIQFQANNILERGSKFLLLIFIVAIGRFKSEFNSFNYFKDADRNIKCN